MARCTDEAPAIGSAQKEDQPLADCGELRSQRKRVLGFVGFAVALALAYVKPLFALASNSAGTDLHSHILLIPLISAYALYIWRKELPRAYASSFGVALLPLAIGVAALLFAFKSHPPLSHNDFLSLLVFSCMCFLAAGGFVFLGRSWMAAAAFPTAFLVLMAPLPDRVLNWLEVASQLASAEAAALFFSISGTPMLREGAIFQLPGIAIEVAQECSGIRSSWVLFITALAAAFLFLKSPCRRAVLIAFVAPLAIFRNGFRIWAIGILCVEMGPQMINSFIHHQGGPLFFALSLIPLFLLLRWLRRGETGRVNPQITQINTDERKESGTATGY
jgi:exosortase C (VPDSG-CTERM-specific)